MADDRIALSARSGLASLRPAPAEFAAKTAQNPAELQTVDFL